MTYSVAEHAITTLDLDGHCGGTVWGLFPLAFAIASLTITALIGLAPGLRYSETGPVVLQIANWVILAPFLVIAIPAYIHATGFSKLSRGGKINAAIWTAAVIVFTFVLATLLNAWIAGKPLSPAIVIPDFGSFFGGRPIVLAVLGLLNVAAVALIYEASLRGMLMGGLIDRGASRWTAAITALVFSVIAAFVIGAWNLFQASLSYGGFQSAFLPTSIGFLTVVSGAVVLIGLRLITGSVTACVIAGMVWAFGGTYITTAAQFRVAGYDPYESPWDEPSFGGAEDWSDLAYADPGATPFFYDRDGVVALAEGYGFSDDLFAFSWEETSQGYDYWSREYDRLIAIGDISPGARDILQVWLADSPGSTDAADPFSDSFSSPAPSGPAEPGSPPDDLDLERARRLAEGVGTAEDLDYAMLWANTPQGSDYWGAEYDNMLAGAPLSAEAQGIFQTWVGGGSAPAIEPAPIDTLGYSFLEIDRLQRLANGSGSAEDLDYAFPWDETPQGFAFWSAEYDQMIAGEPLSENARQAAQELLAGVED